MSEFVRFPSIPYLIRPAGVDIRGDKVLSADERDQFLSSPLQIEEKIDGENLGISYDGNELQFQARGSYVELGGRHFRGLSTWIRPRASRIARAIASDLVLFGEWCVVAHSVNYDKLPDWFLLFDVYDRSSRTFWKPSDRDAFAKDLELSIVPFVGMGHFIESDLEELLGVSLVGSDEMEGVVLRALDDSAPCPRAKVVRPNFVQGIKRHWMTQSHSLNRLSV